MMNHLQYRDEVLNAISPSFCGAKWLNATIWLGDGRTASCHHPQAHQIDADAVRLNPKALHNTPQKKEARSQMLKGERPDECGYCWKIEDLGPDKVSDRVYKSMIYPVPELQALALRHHETDVNLQTLEIAFDANCNFACSYCNAMFSTKWQTDIKTNGPYLGLISDGAPAYGPTGPGAMPYGPKNVGNPYVEAFWKWWISDLQYTLRELRITGGEATMSPEFWNLMDWYEANPSCKTALALNTNLGFNQRMLLRLVQLSGKVQQFDVYTSNESYGPAAEYIRDGLEWSEWIHNLDYLLHYGQFKHVNVMMTVNALCLTTITEFLDVILGLKRKYGRSRCLLSVNILRFPSFQSALTLDAKDRERYAVRLEAWLTEHRKTTLLSPMEVDSLDRLVAYLREVETGFAGSSDLERRQWDFRMFYEQYDERRGKAFRTTFPEFAEWYDSISRRPAHPIIPILPILPILPS